MLLDLVDGGSKPTNLAGNALLILLTFFTDLRAEGCLISLNSLQSLLKQLGQVLLRDGNSCAS